MAWKEATPEEERLIRKNRIPLATTYSKDAKSSVKQLERIGFTRERAVQLVQANVYAPRVLGARGSGVLVQEARRRAAAQLGLSPLSSQREIERVARERGVEVAPAGYTYTDEQGRKFPHVSKEFIEKKEAERKQTKVTITTQKPQYLVKDNQPVQQVESFGGGRSRGSGAGVGETGGAETQSPSVSVGDLYLQAEETTSKYTTKPFFNVFRSIGLDLTSTKTQMMFAPSMIGIGTFGISPKGYKEFESGISAGMLKDVEEKPLKQIALFGGSYVVGGLARGVPLFAQAGTRAMFGTTASKIVGGTAKVGIFGAGAYLTTSYAISKGKEIYYAPTPEAGGSTLGVSFKDMLIVGKGIQKGTQGAEKLYGYMRTRGIKQDLTEIATDPRVEARETKFPVAGEKLSTKSRAKLHKKLFESNKELAKALGVKQGGIHATPQSTATFKEITKPVHIAHKTSPAFLDMEGGSSSLVKVPQWKTFLKDLFVVKEPGLFWMESPKGFKINIGTEVGRKYYKWSEPLTSGKSAYIPATKSEVQSVFDPAVTKGFEPVPFTPSYVKTLGVRVPFINALTPVSKVTPSTITPGEFFKITSSYGAESSPIVSTKLGYMLYRSSGKPSTPATPISSVPSSTTETSSYVPPISYSPTPPTSSKPRRSYNPPTSYTPPSYVPPSPVTPSPSKPARSYLFRSLPAPKFLTSSAIVKLPEAKESKPSGRYPVLLRRFGQFKFIGYGRTPKEALDIGRQSASRTLGATFKIPGLKPHKLFGFRTKVSKKEGVVYIEKPKYRLSTPTELAEIGLFRRKKKKKRRT